MASKRRSIFYENKKQEATEIDRYMSIGSEWRDSEDGRGGDPGHGGEGEGVVVKTEDEGGCSTHPRHHPEEPQATPPPSPHLSSAPPSIFLPYTSSDPNSPQAAIIHLVDDWLDWALPWMTTH
ncbi:hypothetical protein AAG570_000824 [Ranatra chinensis]|uniref:Uncharacterized protein n=1 Tax=Ranatra chinensis TaxID=642074 RepID=A0ABD0YY68_9HEMI